MKVLIHPPFPFAKFNTDVSSSQSVQPARSERQVFPPTGHKYLTCQGGCWIRSLYSHSIGIPIRSTHLIIVLISQYLLQLSIHSHSIDEKKYQPNHIFQESGNSSRYVTLLKQNVQTKMSSGDNVGAIQMLELLRKYVSMVLND